MGAVKQGSDAGRSPFWRSLIEVVSLLGPASVLNGLLFYCGYVSAKAFWLFVMKRGSRSGRGSLGNV
jgi:hypothetical protein